MADLDRYQYGYDQNSNRLWKANVVGTPVVSGGLDEYYSYDNLNRLTAMRRGTLNSGKTGITGTSSREMDYTLDPTGNWSAYLTKTAGTTDLNQTRSHNPVNEITAIGGTPTWATPPAYDPAGNMNSFPQPGSPSSAYTATYDAWNRMVSVSASGSTVAEYQYDGANRRAVKRTYSGGTLSETQHIYYTSDWQDVEERVGTSTSMDKQFVWGIRYVDELVCRDDATPERLYVTQDANFNVTALIDTSGDVRQRFLYDPYGNSTVLTGSWTSTSDTYAWTRRFTGQEFDQETSLFLLRQRYFHPSAGRFLQRDPIAYQGGINLYEYVGSKPLLWTDPNGLQATQPSPTSCTCGPDITDWLEVEVAGLDLWSSKLAQIFQKIPRIVVREAYRIAFMKIVGPKLNYFPATSFSSPNCPSGPQCNNTVTITGICVHTSAIGNFIFGMLMSNMGFSEDAAEITAIIANGFKFQTPGNQEALDLGYEWASFGGTVGQFLSMLAPGPKSVLGSNAPAVCGPCSQTVDATQNHFIENPFSIAKNVN